MYENTRKSGLKLLSGVSKKSEKIEQNIFKFVDSVLENDEYLGIESFEDVYNRCIFQLYWDLYKGSKTKDVILKIKKNKIDWNHEMYDKIKASIHEQDDFIMNPFEVEEGVLHCDKCGGDRVFSYTKQHRGGDEPMTTYAECVNSKCKAKWSYAG